jgi:polyphosphate glucokinase
VVVTPPGGTPLLLGVDVGGTAIKVGAVHSETGTVVGAIERAPTPSPATPGAVSTVIDRAVRSFPEVRGPIGCAVPAVVRDGVTTSAANIDPSWIGLDVANLLASTIGRPVAVVNDADAAGIAEIRHGAGRAHRGVVLVVTLGTGIGTALFVDGRLVPNTELGHIEVDGRDAELQASERARVTEGLSWSQFAARVDRYLAVIEDLLNPDLVILGGGVSAHAGEFVPLLRRRTPVVPATLRNDAGIVGAAMSAAGR